MTIKRFNKLTQDEFLLMQGTEKLTQMISNKFYTEDSSVLDFIEESALWQWCAIRHGQGFILYFENLEDANRAIQYSLEPNTPSEPPIHSINIVHEHN